MRVAQSNRGVKNSTAFFTVLLSLSLSLSLQWYDAFGSEMESGFQEQRKQRGGRGAGIRSTFGSAAAGLSSGKGKHKKKTKKKGSSGRPPFLRRRKSSQGSASSGGESKLRRHGSGFSLSRSSSSRSYTTGGGGGGGEGDDGVWATTSSFVPSGGGGGNSSVSSRDPRRGAHGGRGSSSSSVHSSVDLSSSRGGGGGGGGMGGGGGSTGGQIIPTAADQRQTLGPRAKPGLEISFSAGVTVHLIRRNALGESGPGRYGRWLQRCRVAATGLRAGGVREPSDGWGSPPPQHRGWLSVSSFTVGMPPSYPESGIGDGGSKGAAAGAGATSGGAGGSGGAAGGMDRSGRRFFRAGTGAAAGESSSPGGSFEHFPPWLVCRAAEPTPAAAAAAAAAGGASTENETSGGGGGGRAAGSSRAGRGSTDALAGGGGGDHGDFLDVRVAGRGGTAAGTGSCASLVMRVGEVEAWALGGAATRWVERLGPEVMGK